MTRRESAILSAYTGMLLGPFDALHKYVEELVGGPVYTHQFADAKFAARIKELAHKDLVALCEAIPTKD